MVVGVQFFRQGEHHGWCIDHGVHVIHLVKDLGIFYGKKKLLFLRRLL